MNNLKQIIGGTIGGVIFSLGIKTANANLTAIHNNLENYGLKVDSCNIKYMPTSDSTTEWFEADEITKPWNPQILYNGGLVFGSVFGSERSDSNLQDSSIISYFTGKGIYTVRDTAGTDSVANYNFAKNLFDTLTKAIGDEEKIKPANTGKNSPGLFLTKDQAKREFVGKDVRDLSGRRINAIISSGTYFAGKRKYSVIR